MPAEIDESLLLGETPEAHVRRLAEAKARAVIPRAGERPVLAADTVARSLPAGMMFQSELPVGVVTALVGAPCFVWLLRKQTIAS